MRCPLSDRAIAAKVGVSHTAIGRWRRGDLRLSVATEARVRAVLDAESGRRQRDEQHRRVGEQVMAFAASALVEAVS